MKNQRLMKLRIALLLLVAFSFLAGSLIGPRNRAISVRANCARRRPARFAPRTHSAHACRQRLRPAGQTRARQFRFRRLHRDHQARVNEVRVVFTVTDRHGRYIKDLQEKRLQSDRRSKARGDAQLPQRDRSAPAGGVAGGRQQFRARPLQVRAGSGHRVSERHHSPAL